MALIITTTSSNLTAAAAAATATTTTILTVLPCLRLIAALAALTALALASLRHHPFPIDLTVILHQRERRATALQQHAQANLAPIDQHPTLVVRVGWRVHPKPLSIMQLQPIHALARQLPPQARGVRRCRGTDMDGWLVDDAPPARAVTWRCRGRRRRRRRQCEPVPCTARALVMRSLACLEVVQHLHVQQRHHLIRRLGERVRIGRVDGLPAARSTCHHEPVD